MLFIKCVEGISFYRWLKLFIIYNNSVITFSLKECNNYMQARGTRGTYNSLERPMAISGTSLAVNSISWQYACLFDGKRKLLLLIPLGNYQLYSPYTSPLHQSVFDSLTLSFLWHAKMTSLFCLYISFKWITYKKCRINVFHTWANDSPLNSLVKLCSINYFQKWCTNNACQVELQASTD